MSNKPAILDFKNRQEMANWFDTHEPLDYDVEPIEAENVEVSLCGDGVETSPVQIGGECTPLISTLSLPRSAYVA